MLRLKITRRLLAALLTLALALLGFGHNMLAPAELDLVAYAMPDGTLPDLCLEGSDGSGIFDPSCPACTIAASLCIPAPVILPAIELTTALAHWPVVSQPTAQAHQPRAPPAHGPPAAFPIV